MLFFIDGPVYPTSQLLNNLRNVRRAPVGFPHHTQVSRQIVYWFLIYSSPAWAITKSKKHRGQYFKRAGGLFTRWVNL